MQKGKAVSKKKTLEIKKKTIPETVMGNPKLKWTAEEENALIAGIKKHSAGKWKTILTDPEFAEIFSKRTNIDLKDKWRNLSVSMTGHHGIKDKSMIPVLKSLISANAQCSESHAVVTRETPLDVVMEDATNNAHEPKNSHISNDTIFEAVSASPHGLDISGIVAFIEKKQEVQNNLRRTMSSRLRRLVAQGKLDKVQNLYIIKKATLALPESRTASMTMQKDSAMEEVATRAAYMIADADNKSYLASEAVKEAERVMKMCEEAECLFHLAKEIHSQCSQGQVVLLA